jgi:hypothetical protein
VGSVWGKPNLFLQKKRFWNVVVSQKVFIGSAKPNRFPKSVLFVRYVSQKMFGSGKAEPCLSEYLYWFGQSRSAEPFPQSFVSFCNAVVSQK